MLVVFLYGISSGFPIVLLYQTIKIWLRKEGIDLSTVGYIGLLTLPYSFNFLWAPVLDRYQPFKIGRRRSWALITQVALLISILSLAYTNPSESLWPIIIIGSLVGFFSATQDVAIDAYRREILEEEELGIGAALAVYGYRIGMWLVKGPGLFLVDPETLGLSFQQSFYVIALFSLFGILTSLYLAREPEEIHERPTNLVAAYVEPFREFLKRHGALVILAFVFLYKFGDGIAGSMLGPFYVDMGYSNKTIAEVGANIGLFGTLIGLAIGGTFVYRFGYFASLLLSGILQALATFSFTIILYTGPSYPVLATVIAAEDISGGMGTAALVAYMSHLTNRAFTAAQYALLASIAALGRTIFAGGAGILVETIGYFRFFALCSIVALAGLMLIFPVKKIAERQNAKI